MGVSQERRAKLVIAILGVLAILLLLGSVGAGLVASGERVEIEWLVLTLVSTFGFIFVVGIIVEVLSREPSKWFRPVRPWQWLLIPALGTAFGLLLGLADYDRFWSFFVFGFTVGTLGVGFGLLSHVVPPAVRRFAKPS